jgi:uncharacterized protein (TIGR03545 family)
MRKKFVYFVLVPLLVLLAVLYFFLDGWVESGLETAGESLVGARVEIDHLRLSLSPLGIRFARMQVANPDDPWKNLFETRTVQFSLDLNQLLRGKYIIEQMEVNDIILGTKRTTDGSLPGARRAAPVSGGPTFTALVQDVLEKTVEKTPLFDPAMLRRGVNVDSLVRAQNFQTLALVDSLRQSVATASLRWDSVKSDLETGMAKLKEIESNIRSINPSALKTPDQILAAVTTVDNSYKTVTSIEATFDARQKSVRGYFDQLAGSVGTIPRAVEKDYQKVLGLARLPDFNAMGLAELIVGKQLLSEILTYARWADVARAQIAKHTLEPEIQKPPRMKGQNIHFPVERGYPKFWIKKIRISGGTDRTQEEDYIYAKGEVRSISSDQALAGEPLSIDLQGTRSGETSFTLGALIDRRKEIPFDEYRVQATGIRLATYELGKSDFLPSKITNARLNSSVNVTIPGDRFDAAAELEFRNLTLEFGADPRNVGERLAREILRGISGFDARLRLWTARDGLDVAFSSDIDDQFAARAKAALGAELTRLQNEIRAKVDGTIQQKRREFESLYESKKTEVLAKLGDFQSVLTQVTGLAEGKKQELLAQLEKQKAGALDGVMKNLFKK